MCAISIQKPILESYVSLPSNSQRCLASCPKTVISWNISLLFLVLVDVSKMILHLFDELHFCKTLCIHWPKLLIHSCTLYMLPTFLPRWITTPVSHSKVVLRTMDHSVSRSLATLRIANDTELGGLQKLIKYWPCTTRNCLKESCWLVCKTLE